MLKFFVAGEQIYVTETGRVDFALKFQPLLCLLLIYAKTIPKDLFKDLLDLHKALLFQLSKFFTRLLSVTELIFSPIIEFIFLHQGSVSFFKNVVYF